MKAASSCWYMCARTWLNFSDIIPYSKVISFQLTS
jgi:hypothetical protein